jgi:hypothetical protein
MAYLAKGTIGNVGMPGAPIVTFQFLVVPDKKTVSGTATITQAIEKGTYSGPVSGSIYATGFGTTTQIVTFAGVVYREDDGALPLNFEAHLAIDAKWNGSGGFKYGNTHVENVPVTSTE